MTKNFIHFLSETPSVLSINGKEIGIIDNKNNFELDIITQTNSIYANYMPLIEKENYLSYAFAIDTENKPQSSSDYIKIIPFPNNHYDIIMKPFYYYQIGSTEVLLNQSIGKYFVSITNNNVSNIIIYNGTGIVFSTTTYKLANAKAEIKKDYIIIEGVIDSDNYYLLILDTKDFSVIYNDKCQSIENTESYIQSFKKLHTIPRHAMICKVDYNSRIKEFFYVYENEFPELPKSKQLIPYALFDAIKVGDEKLISIMLANNLKNTPLQKFKDYFGNFSEVYLNRHQEFTHKLNYTIYNNSYKNYNFIIDGNTISDIEEIF